MTAADDLIPVWQDAAAEIAEALHADTYEIVRSTEVPDGYGGTTTTTATVESGRCILDVIGRGTEAIAGTVPVATSPYTADLPIDSSVTETDTLLINGRTFAVISVARGGNFEMFTTVGLEESGS